MDGDWDQSTAMRKTSCRLRLISDASKARKASWSCLVTAQVNVLLCAQRVASASRRAVCVCKRTWALRLTFPPVLAWSGCQDIVRFWQLHHTTSTYSASILQAPVSDREYAEAPNTYADRDLLVRTIAACEAQIAAGDGAFFPPPATIREMYGGTPVSVSAERWVSMVARGGKEDFFSSDLTEEEMARAFCGMKAAAERQDRAKAKSLILVGGSDECVPDRIDKEKLVQRMARHAGPGAEGRVLEGANHNIEDVEAQRTFVDMVIDLIKGL